MRSVTLAAASAVAVGSLLLGMSAAASAEEPPAAPAAASVSERIAAASEAGATTPSELADAAGLPADGPASLQVGADGRLSATVTFAATPTAGQLARVRAHAEIVRTFTIVPAVAVKVAGSELDDLAEIPGVVTATPDLLPATARIDGAGRAAQPRAAAAAESCRAFPSDADAPQKADLARAQFGVDGTGQTVGILSDSYANQATQEEIDTTEVQKGLLPGPGNPCGYETPVEVLADYVPPTPDRAGKDEGRAMAELVHGIAPGARLIFNTAQSNGLVGFAQGILDLADAGATVIVDDIGYSSEPYYQQGLISYAINQVRAKGVAYYTAAGNQNGVGREGTASAGKPIASWQTPAFRAMDCPTWVRVPEGVASADCLNFDPSGGQDVADLLTLDINPSGGRPLPTFLLNWGQPMGGATAGLTLQVYDDAAQPNLIASSSPIAAGYFPNATLGLPADTATGQYNLVLVRDTAAGAATPDPAIWIGTFGNSAAIVDREHNTSKGVDVVGPTTIGHPADGSGVGVAAAYWATPQTPEYFSSLGPGTQLFAPFDPDSQTPAQKLDAPVTVPAPRIAGTDGIRTSFFSSWDPTDQVWRFYGTSAAAPDVAAVHALAAQYAPGLPADTILEKLLETAAPMQNPYAGFAAADVFGAGMVDAQALLEALPAPAPAAVSATAASATSVRGEWDEVRGATGYRVELLSGDRVVQSADAAADARSTTFPGLRPETDYRVRVTTRDTDGKDGGSAESATVRTPIPPRPAVAPPAPRESDLDQAHRGTVATDAATVKPGGVVTLTGLPDREWVYGWAFSSPVALDWAWTSTDGVARFTVPQTLPAGTHRIAVTNASGAVLGWVEITVAATLPATGLGADLSPLALLGAGGILLGAALVVARRTLRRRSRA